MRRENVAPVPALQRSADSETATLAVPRDSTSSRSNFFTPSSPRTLTAKRCHPGVPRDLASSRSDFHTFQACYVWNMAQAIAVSIAGRYYRRKGFKTLAEPAYVKDIVQPLERYSEKNNP